MLGFQQLGFKVPVFRFLERRVSLRDVAMVARLVCGATAMTYGSIMIREERRASSAIRLLLSQGPVQRFAMLCRD